VPYLVKDPLKLTAAVNSGFEVINSKWSIEGGFYHDLTNLYASSVKATLIPLYLSQTKVFITGRINRIEPLNNQFSVGIELPFDRSTKFEVGFKKSLSSKGFTSHIAFEWTPALDCIPGHKKLLYKPVFSSWAHNLDMDPFAVVAYITLEATKFSKELIKDFNEDGYERDVSIQL
jgi:hypothetical protein